MTTGARLRLRPPIASDEPQVRAAQSELAPQFNFTQTLGPDDAFADWIALLAEQRQGRDPDPRRVPGTFLLGVVGDEVVGRASVRHLLNDVLRSVGGHIGYCVRPAFRRRGYATEMLRQSLIVARAKGIDRVLVTCDEQNVASATVIERCGGVLDPDWPHEGDKRRYWID